jgi:hypothetical protein
MFGISQLTQSEFTSRLTTVIATIIKNNRQSCTGCKTTKNIKQRQCDHKYGYVEEVINEDGGEWERAGVFRATKQTFIEKVNNI